MGIGLVDPILKPIADNLNASPPQVSLLFTSYMTVMGVAMMGIVGWRALWGLGQRPVHRDRAGHHRHLGERLCGTGGQPL